MRAMGPCTVGIWRVRGHKAPEDDGLGGIRPRGCRTGEEEVASGRRWLVVGGGASGRRWLVVGGG